MAVFDRRKKPGGLNEYGIATYKTIDDFAAREVDWLLAIGGITMETGRTLGIDLTLSDLEKVVVTVQDHGNTSAASIPPPS